MPTATEPRPRHHGHRNRGCGATAAAPRHHGHGTAHRCTNFDTDGPLSLDFVVYSSTSAQDLFPSASDTPVPVHDTCTPVQDRCGVKLQASAVYGGPSFYSMTEAGGLPNESCPSDHLSICAWFDILAH